MAWIPRVINLRRWNIVLGQNAISDELGNGPAN